MQKIRVLIADDQQALAKELKSVLETDEEIEKRLSRLEYELSQKDKYDFVVINDNLEKAIADVENILDA